MARIAVRVPVAGSVAGWIQPSIVSAPERFSVPDCPTRMSLEVPLNPIAVLEGSDAIKPGTPRIAPTNVPGFATVWSPATVPLVSSRRQ